LVRFSRPSLAREYARGSSRTVPLGDPKRWAALVAGPLISTLEFLSEDAYRFEFVPRAPEPPPPYFTFGGGWTDRSVDEIVPFRPPAVAPMAADP
jgi:hypothetical protein